jgi:Flp pilus assembly pilin Flp
LAWWEYAVLLTLVAGALVVFVAQVHAFERLLSWLGSRGYGGEQR